MLSYTKEILRFLSQEQILNGEAFFIYIDEKGEKKISLNLTNTTATQFEFIRMKFLHAIRSAHSRNFFFFLFLKKPSFHGVVINSVVTKRGKARCMTRS